MKPFSVVIPLFNDETNFKLFFEENYQRIKKIHAENDIVLIDDTGNDGIYPIIKNKYLSNINIIKHDKNLGFSKSVNDGIRNAKSEIVFVFNSDILTTDLTFQNVLHHFSNEDVFAVSLKSIYPDGKVREGAKKLVWQRGLPTIKHSPKDYPKPSKDGKIYSVYPVGGHFAVRKSMFLDLNGFDYNLYHPFYYEDTDIGIRAAKKGWKTVFEPKSEVIHPPENSSIKKNFEKEYISKIRWNNRIYFTLKNFKSRPFSIYIRWGLLLRFFQYLFKYKNFIEPYNLTFNLINKFERKSYEN